MGQQIIKQPDGKYAIFSTVVDDFVALNCTRRDILDNWMDDYRDRIWSQIVAICDSLELGGKPYHQFTMTWEEANQLILERTESRKEGEKP